MKRFLITLVIVATSGLLGASSRAETTAYNQDTQTCGAYTFEVTRLVDGFFFRVTDGTRLRTIFHRDPYQPSSVYSNTSAVVASCTTDGALAIVDSHSAKYSIQKTISLLDPRLDPLQIKQFGSQTTVQRFGDLQDAVTTIPAERATDVANLLAMPTMPWTIDRTGLVGKKRVAPEASNILNDRSFFVHDGGDGIERRLADSNWNSTMAVDSVVTDTGIAYVLYVKHFAASDTPTSTSPSVQYVIERSGDGRRVLIPVPHVADDWKNYSNLWTSGGVRLVTTSGDDAALLVGTRVTMVTGQTSFVDALDPATSTAVVDYASIHDYVQMTGLYVAAERDGLVLRSFYLKKPMLLHGLTGTSFVLDWYRIGPLEKDGTRKVWYGFTANGATQTWQAIVR
ncbi:MAG: hypothetical protein V1745_00610 [Patescibacteria group bacterium]